MGHLSILQSLPDASIGQIRKSGIGILSHLSPEHGRIGFIFRKFLQGEEVSREGLEEILDIIEEKRDEILDRLQVKPCIFRGREDDEPARKTQAEIVLAEIEGKIQRALGIIDISKPQEFTLIGGDVVSIIPNPREGIYLVQISGSRPGQFKCENYEITDEKRHIYFSGIIDSDQTECAYNLVVTEPKEKWEE